MNFFTTLSQYSFMQNALIVGLLSSISCGIIGTYIVNKKMVFISSSISHASFGGIGIGIYIISIFNLPLKDPLFFGIIFAIISGILILVLKDHFGIDDDLGIGVIMSMGMAIGIIFSYITPGYQNDLSTYLFGNILLSNRENMISLFVLNIITIIFFKLFYRGIIYTSFDENYYSVLGVPSKFINYFMMILVASTLVINIKIIGIMLIISILTIPQAIAGIIVKKYSHIIWFSILFSFIVIFSGLYFSYIWNIPSGPTIIMALITIFGIVKLLYYLHIDKNKI